MYCSDYTAIENYKEAVKSTEFYEIHHRLEDLGFSKKDLIYLGLYYNVPPDELIYMSKSAHMSHHNKGDKNPFKKVSYLYRGENSPTYGKKWVEKDGEKKFIDESKLNSYLSKGYKNGFTWTGNSRKGTNNPQYGKSDIEAAYYWKYISKGEIPPAVLKSMESKYDWTPSCYPLVRDKNFKLIDY